eukprot:TRINITY_DN20910_c0_g1_i1.p1 TRINITY_DN20910_c0_g1~~TRINITY_DN20910_c0_g1_i1.p1  ORF type:complete len:515 (-),score=120.46 TRINITY_DN20910_c0_g1_i1:35-1579(-)
MVFGAASGPWASAQLVLLSTLLLRCAGGHSNLKARAAQHRREGDLLRRDASAADLDALDGSYADEGLHRTAETYVTRNPQGCWKPLMDNVSDAESRAGGEALLKYYSILAAAGIKKVFDKTTKKTIGADELPASVRGQKRCPTPPAATDLASWPHPLDIVLPGLIDPSVSFQRATEIQALLKMKLKKPPLPTDGPEVRAHVLAELAKLPKGEVAILTAVDFYSKLPKQASQFQNFFCGLRRLGLHKQLVAFAQQDAGQQLVRDVFPEAAVLRDDRLVHALDALGSHVRVSYNNRIAKLAWAALLLENGHEVLVSDTDSFWFTDPLPQLRHSGGDMAAMQDLCVLELNSGLVYYRPTEASRLLMRTVLLTPKIAPFEGRYELPTDNDQYLLNCAVVTLAARGDLRPMLLARGEYHFGSPNNVCRDPRNLVIWHVGGMTGLSKEKDYHSTDVFRGRGLWDLNDELLTNLSEVGDVPASGAGGAAAARSICRNSDVDDVDPWLLRSLACDSRFEWIG